MRWIWDPAKDAENKRKHGVSFATAERALGDPLCITILDPCPEEERWRTLGAPSAARPEILFIVHTWPEEDDAPARIISARRATARERQYYEER